MTWLEVQIATTLEAEEAVVNLFYETGAKGVVIESTENLMMLKEDPTVNYIDESILNMDPNASIVRGYFNEELDCDECIHQLLTGIKKLPSYGLDPGSCELSITEVEEDDWANSWKKYYKPTKVGKRIVIKPTWEEYEAKEDEIIVNMDPGMAFGTGTHETTQLCVTRLEEYVKPGDMVLDIGCGTGILSMIAAELGCEKVIGVDLDPVAVKVAQDNIEMNGLSDKIEIREGNLVEVIDAAEKADIIVANILAEAIIELSGMIIPFLKENGVFIASGIINDRLEAVLDQLNQEGFEILNIEQMGEWNSVSSRLKISE